MKKIFLQTIAMIAVMGGALTYFGSTGRAQEPSKPAPSVNTTVSDKDLNAFVKTYVEYQKIRQAYEPSLEKTQDSKEKQKIAQEANSKLEKTLEKHGLTAEKYNRIFTAVNKDEGLRKKTLKLIDQERKR